MSPLQPVPSPQGVRSGAPGLAERHAASPRLACESFARAVNSADLDSALACFAPGACLIAPGGAALYGEGPIRGLLAQLIASRAEIAIDLAGVLVATDLALAHERWTINAEGAAPFRTPATGSWP